MERLLELYKEVSAYPRTCDLSKQQKEVVFEFFREFNKHLRLKRSGSICNRYGIVDHARKYLTAHGLI